MILQINPCHLFNASQGLNRGFTVIIFLNSFQVHPAPSSDNEQLDNLANMIKNEFQNQSGKQTGNRKTFIQPKGSLFLPTSILYSYMVLLTSSRLYSVNLTAVSFLAGIIYCFSRNDTERVASELTKRGINGCCYHAWMASEEKALNHRNWIENKIQVCLKVILYIHNNVTVECKKRLRTGIFSPKFLNP